MGRTAFRRLLALCLALAAGGCGSLAPEYHRPDAPVALDWPGGQQAPAGAGMTARDIPWQRFFAEPRLHGLIELALRENRDLRVAVLNIERARALYQIQRAAQFPSVDVSALESAQRTPGSLSPSGQALTSHQYSLSVGISSYELDFFGRVQSLREQALQEFLGTVEARRAAQITLVAEVAADYLLLAADQERLKLAQDTLASQEASYRLTLRSYELGWASGLDRAQAQTSVDTARADVASFTSQVEQDLNLLTLVVGAPLSPDLLPQRGDTGPLTEFADLPAGLPSEVLQERPDVLRAERTLQAAQANIGAARAAFFPRISLTASAGLASGDLDSLFKGASRTWSFLPSIDLPIFDAGSRRANLRGSEITRDIAVADYERAIQTAFREVADALAARRTLNEQLAARQSLVESTTLIQRLADALYRNGTSSYLEVLDAQRSLYSAQQSLIAVRLARLNNLVTVYKVLGGGWLDARAAPDAAEPVGAVGTGEPAPAATPAGR